MGGHSLYIKVMQNEEDFVLGKIIDWFETKGVKSGHPENIQEDFMTKQKAECISRLQQLKLSNPEEAKDTFNIGQNVNSLSTKETNIVNPIKAIIFKRRVESKDSLSTRKGSSEEKSQGGGRQFKLCRECKHSIQTQKVELAL